MAVPDVQPEPLKSDRISDARNAVARTRLMTILVLVGGVALFGMFAVIAIQFNSGLLGVMSGFFLALTFSQWKELP